MIAKLAFLLSSLVFAFGANDSGQDINTNPLSVHSVVLSPARLSPGMDAEITVFFNLPPGFHAYIDQFKLEIESPTGIYLGELTVNPIVDFTDPVTKKIKKGTEGSGTLSAPVKVASGYKEGESRLNLFLTYQACTKDYCLFPQKIPLHSSISAASPTGSSEDPLTLAMEKGVWAAFLLAFLAGILTSFTPCIFPMIPITLAVLGTHGQSRSRSRGLAISATYVLGIALTYAVLGLVAALTGSLFGSLLGHPVVVGAVALIFVLMGLSMYGLFEVKLPDTWANKISGTSLGKSGGYVGAFASGLVAGIVASPCVGPVLVSILTYVAQTQDIVLGFSLLFVFALGLGQLFLVLGTFSQLLQRLPRSGPWLGYVKFIFGTTMIAMALYFIYPVAKPWFSKGRVQEGQTVSTCASESEDGMTCEVPTADFAKPEWRPYSEEALAEAKAAGRPVIIDFKAEWCEACHQLERDTFSDPRILEMKEFIWLDFDATSSSPELDALRAKYRILGLPFVTFYDVSGQWRNDLTLTGFENADKFLERMQKAKK